MALLKMGAIVTAIKGKIGGTIFQGSASGQTAKNKYGGAHGAGNATQNWWPNKNNPQNQQCRQANNTSTPAVSEAISNPSIFGSVFFDGSRNGWVGPSTQQAIVATLSSTWRNLDDTARLSWSNGAVNYPFKNKLGEPYIGSGYQVYMQLNTNLLQIFQPALTLCPIPSASVLPTITMDWANQMKAQLALVYFPDGIDAGVAVQVYASPPRSAGRTSTLNSQLIATIDSGTALSVPLRQVYEMSKGFIASTSTIVFSFFVINKNTGVQTPVVNGKLKVVFGGRGQIAIITDASVVRAWNPTDLSTTINLGSFPNNSDNDLPFLLYGLQLGDPWSLTKGGADPTQFDFSFNGVSPTAGVISGGCDSFGDMIGFALNINFAPTTVGVKTFTITLDCPAIPFTKTVTFQATSV